jgi:hypothetical protein
MSILSAGTSNTTSLVYTGDTTGAMVFQTNGTTEAMRINAAQNVGIGTNSPSSKLDVVKSSIVTTAFDDPQIRAINGGTSTANQRVDIAMRWQDGAYNGTGGISMVRESSTARNGALTFSSIPSDGNGTERMRIDSSGNLGIGTSSPTTGSRLDVVTDYAATQYVNVVRAKTTSTSDVHPFVLLENNRGGTPNAVRIGMDTSASAGDVYMLFQIKNSGGTFTNRMLIYPNGQITMPTQPAFAAWGNGGNNGSASAGNVTAFTEKFDIGNNFNAGVFTAPVGGVYEFAYSINNGGGGGTPRSRIRVNGADYFGQIGGAGALQLRGQVDATNLWAVFLIQMAANDTAQIYTESTYSTESAYLYFQGRLVS